MKPRIFISMHYLEIGGAETALIGLLNALDHQKVDVDLFLHDHRGEMMEFIPSYIRLLPAVAAYTVLERPVVELIKRGYWGISLARLWAKLVSKFSYSRSDISLPNMSEFHYMAEYTSKFLPPISPDVSYDMAISFMNPHQFVLQKVKAKKKIAWIHTDYTKIWIDVKSELKVWKTFDYIVSISEDVTRTFLQVFPDLSSKVTLIENILSPQFVRDRASRKIVDPLFGRKEGECILLSVGRFAPAKNYDNVPAICRLLVEKGVNVKWYIIGYGGDEVLIKHRIAEAGMQQHVIILGKRSNPYPYMNACDIYVQPSRYEGKSVTVREAQMLCKPVVVTNYSTASSQIKDGVDGVIVPMDNHLCAEGLFSFIRNKSLQTQIVSYLKTHDYGNEKEVDKIYSLI